MVFETITGLISFSTGMATGIASGLLEINPLFLLAGLIVVIILVFYVLKTLMKIAIVGLFSALLVMVANFLGFPIPISLQTLITTAMLGIIFYTVLKYVEIAFKILKAATYPVRRIAKKRKNKNKPEKQKYEFNK